MAVADALILVAFVAWAAAAGFRSRQIAGRDLEEYFLAGRNVSGWAAGLSMAATQFAADTPLLVTGLVATAGVFALWRLWIYAIALLVLGFLLAPSWRAAKVLTDAELTELRYTGRAALWLRGFKALYFGTLFNCTVLAWVLLAATRIAQPFLRWHEWLPPGLHDVVVALVQRVGVPLAVAGTESGPDVWTSSADNLISLLLIVAVAALYSSTGGLRSVIATDVVQFVLMMIATAVFAWIVVDRAGGLAEIPLRIRQGFPAGGDISGQQLLAFTPGLAKNASAAVLAVIAVQWLAQMNSDGSGYLAQRIMSCRSDRDAKIATVVFTFAQVLLRSLLWIPLALGLLLLFAPDPTLSAAAGVAERETSYVRGMAELLPVGVRGLMLTAMLAALASTVDTHLNWGASYWAHDLYGRIVCRAWRGKVPQGRHLVWIARGSTVVILILALVVMAHLGSIATAWRTSLLLGAGMGGMLLLRWLWWRVTAWGELTALSASLVLAPTLLWGIPDDQTPWIEGWSPEAVRLLAMAAVATTAGVIASLSFHRARAETMVAFYQRARPCGAWGPVAALCGEDPAEPGRRFVRGALAVMTGSLSVFCLLVGIGSWLIDSPSPLWIAPTLWRSALVGSGAALIPVWWRLGLGSPSRFFSDDR